ncbi:putative dienelactone hydrolase domain-containing protein [Eutypa lata UCREL1]|uniref:Putative dienelactone hydrolase domain-containing protein n=1 Tax=Eutypa lata (strain UCR-EL1) TaxID=1287681 RepID=M7SCH4_EUTLA|nr:putative dienelactone hydrolase domain-containing protein [Eutypa lata UCREL1]
MSSPTNVRFPSRGIDIAGHLYTPPPSSNSNPDRHHAAIIIGHPGTGVKEQTAGLYARVLSEAGFMTLAFDAAYQGESGGSPRGLEDPYQRAEDFKAAVTFLSTLSSSSSSINREDEEKKSVAAVVVDPQRIGVLGICASGGYVPFAAQTDKRMRAVATISGACLGDVTRRGIEGSVLSSKVTPDMLDAMLKRSGQDRITAALTGDVPVNAMLPENAADLPSDIPDRSSTKEGIDYYKTPRGSHPRSTNTEVSWGVDLRANYDSYAFNYMISPRPLLMIVGGDADTAY